MSEDIAMNKFSQFCMTVALALSCFDLTAAEFYVAPDGNDANTGTEAKPFATLERARDALRQLRAVGKLDGPATVRLRGGAYALAQTLKLEAKDSGSAEAPVVFRAYGDEKPVLIGGKVVTDFVPGEGQILKADLAAQGLKDASFKQVFMGDQRMGLARYPNFDPQNPITGGWAYVDEKAPTEGTPFAPSPTGRRLLQYLSLIHISEPTRPVGISRIPSSA